MDRYDDTCPYIYPPPCLRARSGRVVALLPGTPTGTLYRNLWRSGRATAQRKSVKLTSLRGYRNPETENLHPSAAKSLLLLKMCVFCCPGARPVVVACSPWGDPKITEILIFFLNVFEWVLEGHCSTRVSARTAEGS